jgi:hypothetical protein
MSDPLWVDENDLITAPYRESQYFPAASESVPLAMALLIWFLFIVDGILLAYDMILMGII